MQHRWRPLFGLILLSSLCAPGQQIPGLYILELTTPPVAEATAAAAPKLGAKIAMRSAAANTHRVRVRSQQAAARAALTAQPGVQVLDSVDTVANALIVQTDDPSVLQNIPGVARVYPVRKQKLLLDRAVMLHKVSDVWNQVGIDHAGRGVKIGIIDTGVDNNHPGLKNSSLTTPSGFPLTTSAGDTPFTSGKVIVARSYVSLLANRDSDTTARDHVGHGTALAMIAAGVRTVAPLATMTGVAPEAWIGSYKVFGTPGVNDGSNDAAIIKALDDAVADGMDVISLSVGSDVTPRLADDPEVAAVERAAKAGVIVVVAAGNNGPDLSTVGSPASAPSAIAVGASTNDRTFGTAVTVPGLGAALAVNGSGVAPSSGITARVTDVAAFDGTGEGCSTYRSGALSGTIALIRRGNCTFETKLQNAQQAGATAALVSAREDEPDPFTMAVGAATLPAQMISFDAGEALRAAVASDPTRTISMSFSIGPVPVTPNRLADFSSTGPNVDLAIKPDVTATGSNFYTATQTYDRNGDMYSSSGFILVSGTSFSTPFVAGVAALLKSTRPGLTVDQYRSLIINTASAMTDRRGNLLGAQRAGAGLVDASAAVNGTAAVAPTSLSFGTGLADLSFTRKFSLTNLGGGDETYSITVEPNGCASAPIPSQDTVAVAAGSTADVDVTWNATSLPAGACEGVFRITGTSSGTTLRLLWWYAVPSGVPAALTQLDISDTGRRGATVRDAVLFRISDAAGIPIGNFTPDVSVVSGGGEIVRIVRYDTDVPGMFGVDLRLGPLAGTNTIEIRAGDVVKRFDIVGR